MIQKMSSNRSICSKVSFDSTRSRGSQRTIRSNLGYESDDGYSTGIDDPSFQITNGIGLTGESVKVLGLDRKMPRHRVFQANMLKPALRSSTKLASRSAVKDNNSSASYNERPDKPLPSRPASHVGPVMGSFNSLRNGTRSNTGLRSRHTSHESDSGNYQSESGFDHPLKGHKPRTSTHTRSSSQPIGLRLRSLFSNLSLTNPSPSTSIVFHSRHSFMTPADNLLDYLRLAKVPSWDRWPGRGKKSVRPPSVLDSNTINEFAKSRGREGWWPYDKGMWIGDIGQANLLQAQVYDSCVQNQVYFFAVTNLKYWVFGQFDASYTSCTVGPLINRKSREPSLMQCLTTWVIRSFDESPRTRDNQHRLTIPTALHAVHTPYISQSLCPTDMQVPPYSEGPRHHRNRRQSLPINNSHDDFCPGNPPNYFIGSTQQGMNMMPGYYDLLPGSGHMANTPYTQPSSASSMNCSMGWGQMPFSPNVGRQLPYSSGLNWYGGGMYPWPETR
ncbi:hypothetical protein I306_01526 [Cryptococcus gattii EJB2]|uniref:YTH domain-containing protein n=1 Tax=Cryptococcus gattii EJB2 TaxID=1296103 RepID=A0ABR5C0L1_9TREE|nr:hypothetical protein I306_01526 [Cryptococcus gattii EJB2]